MADHDELERTEVASPRSVARAQERGNWPRSRELVAACCLLGSIFTLRLAATPALQSARTTIAAGITGLNADVQQIPSIGHQVLQPLVPALAFILVPVIVSVTATIGQVGWRFQPEALAPNMNRFSAREKVSEILSGRSALQALSACAKSACLAGLAAWWIWGEVVVLASAVDPTLTIGHLATMMLRVGTKLACVMVAIGCLDYGCAWWAHLRSMRMSRAELAAELRESEGDPLLRRRRRQIQWDRAAPSQVAKLSQLVLTGRGQIAVSISVDRGDAMRVVAKSVGSSAIRMKRQAQRRGVRTAEHAELVREICRDCRAGERLPASLCERIQALIVAANHDVKSLP